MLSLRAHCMIVEVSHCLSSSQLAHVHVQQVVSDIKLCTKHQKDYWIQEIP